GRLRADHLAPEPRRFQDVGLVDRAHAPRTLARRLEGDARDAPDFALAVAHRVEAFTLAADVAHPLGLAEIDVAGQLAHDEDIEPRHHLGLERGSRSEL